MNIARLGNRYLAECEPWKVWKTDPERVETILNISLQLVANLTIALEPFLPFSCQQLRSMLAIEPIAWEQLGQDDLLPAGHTLAEPRLLFEKIEDEAIQVQLDKLEETRKANAAQESKPQPQKAPIPFQEFEKLDLRVGRVLKCQRVEKTDKLLQLTLDDGTGTERTIVSGIARHYTPEQLIGKQLLFIANLPPRKLMGIESQGMILSAEDPSGALTLATLLGEASPGSPVK